MLQSSRAARSDHRNGHRVSHRSGKRDVISCLGTIAVHTGKKDFPGSKSLHLLRPLYGINACIQTSAVLVNIPSAVLTPFGINSNHHALASELVRCLPDQFRTVNSRRVHGNLVCALPKKPLEVINSTNAAADCKRNKHISRHLAHHIHHSVTLLAGGCNVKKYHLIRSSRIVCLGDLHRVSGILQIYEIHAFHHSPIIHIQAGNNSLRKHPYASFPSFAKFSRILRPYLLLFSG